MTEPQTLCEVFMNEKREQQQKIRELQDRRDRLESALDEDGGNQRLAKDLDAVCVELDKLEAQNTNQP